MFSNWSVDCFYVLLFGQMVYIFGFISQVFSHFFISLFSWFLIRTELYRNWIRAMLMRSPVMILMVVKKGTVLILTGPKLKDSVLTSGSKDLVNLRSPWAIGFDAAVPRRAHSMTWWNCIGDNFGFIFSAWPDQFVLVIIFLKCVNTDRYHPLWNYILCVELIEWWSIEEVSLAQNGLILCVKIMMMVACDDHIARDI